MPFGSRIAKINIEFYIKFQGGNAGSHHKAPHLLSDKMAKRYGFLSFSFVHTHIRLSTTSIFVSRGLSNLNDIQTFDPTFKKSESRDNPRQTLGRMPRTNPRLSPKQDFRRESVIAKLCRKGGSHWLSAARGARRGERCALARSETLDTMQQSCTFSAPVSFLQSPPSPPKSAGNISRCITASLSTQVKSIQCQILSSECEIDSSQCEIYCVNVNIYIHIYIYIFIDPSASLENKVQHLCVNSILYIHEDKSSILVLVKTKDLVGL